MHRRSDRGVKESGTADRMRTRLVPAGKLPGPLLDRLIRTYRPRTHPSVIVSPGYGRDAAAIDVSDVSMLIVKSDPITFTSANAAHYLVAVNANDIACMGGIPRWVSVVALFPEHGTDEAAIETVFRELQEACDAFGVSLIGGHTEVTAGLDRSLLIGTMIGIPGPRGVLEPGKAAPGDELFVTRHIGLEGTAIIAQQHRTPLEAVIGAPIVADARRLMHDPGMSIVGDAAAILAADGVVALHDPTEGGVATAIHELCKVSRAGARIDLDAMPTLPETTAICDHFGLDPLGLLSSGSLLVACRPESTGDLQATAVAAEVPLSHIGQLTSADGGILGVRRGVASALPRFDSDELVRVIM